MNKIRTMFVVLLLTMMAAGTAVEARSNVGNDITIPGNFTSEAKAGTGYLAACWNNIGEIVSNTSNCIAAVGGTPTLAEVLTAGNTANMDIDLNSNNLNNVYSISNGAYSTIYLDNQGNGNMVLSSISDIYSDVVSITPVVFVSLVSDSDSNTVIQNTADYLSFEYTFDSLTRAFEIGESGTYQYVMDGVNSAEMTLYSTASVLMVSDGTQYDASVEVISTQIKQTVINTTQDSFSALTQSPEQNILEVTDNTLGLTSLITQSLNSIVFSVSDISSDMYSTITQSRDGIVLSITDNINSITSTLQMDSGTIDGNVIDDSQYSSVYVTNAESALHSSLIGGSEQSQIILTYQRILTEVLDGSYDSAITFYPSEYSIYIYDTVNSIMSSKFVQTPTYYSFDINETTILTIEKDYIQSAKPYVDNTLTGGGLTAACFNNSGVLVRSTNASSNYLTC